MIKHLTRLYNAAEVSYFQRFRHVSPKKLTFNDKLAMLITTALRYLWSNNVTEEYKTQLKMILQQHPEPFSTHNIKLMPLWIRYLITELYE